VETLLDNILVRTDKESWRELRSLDTTMAKAAQIIVLSAKRDLGDIDRKSVSPADLGLDMLWLKENSHELPFYAFVYGRCLEEGIGCDRNETEALKLYRKAAEQGYARAQSNLGVFYQRGCCGVDKDEAEAVMWYRKAADQDNAIAQYNLGVCYEYGYGVVSDKAMARVWYNKAANQRHQMAESFFIREPPQKS
jgi:TPR repeat protein